MTKPTLGRIVLYQPQTIGADPRPAVITKVWSPTMVNLHVLGGLITGTDGVVEEQGSLPTSVELWDSPEPQKPRTWAWPTRE